MIVLETIRFLLVAALLIAGLFCFASAVIGAWKFGFVLNRLHAAGIGDSLGLLCIAASMMLYSGIGMEMGKLLVIVIFQWITSPVSSHFLSQIEYYTNPSLYSHVAREPETAADSKVGPDENGGPGTKTDSVSDSEGAGRMKPSAENRERTYRTSFGEEA